jgi:cysteine synthase B
VGSGGYRSIQVEPRCGLGWKHATPAASPGGSEIWLKAEWLNPGRSADAAATMNETRASSYLPGYELPGKRLLDSSSGNTAIAYAMLGAAAGVGVTVCVPGNASPERLALLEIYGAQIILTDRMAGSDGAADTARSLAASEPDLFWFADQYGNPANPAAHWETTGPEIWNGTDGGITHFVAALGTTGTIMGTGSYLKSRNSRSRSLGWAPIHRSTA